MMQILISSTSSRRNSDSNNNINSHHSNKTILTLCVSSAVRNGSYDMVQLLIIGGAFVQQVCLKSWTATHEAAKVGCCDILLMLLRHGGQVNGRDGHGVTPLGVAAEYGQPGVLRMLIDHGNAHSLQFIDALLSQFLILTLCISKDMAAFCKCQISAVLMSVQLLEVTLSEGTQSCIVSL